MGRFQRYEDSLGEGFISGGGGRVMNFINFKGKLFREPSPATTAGQLLAEWRKADPNTTKTLTDAYFTLCALAVQEYLTIEVRS
jgi:hypothetical protein